MTEACADSVFTLHYNGNNYSVSLSKPVDEITVKELKEKIAHETKVDVIFQKLIFAGQCLEQEEDFLTKYSIKSGAKLMLLKRKDGVFDPQLDAQLKVKEKDLTEYQNRFTELNSKDIESCSVSDYKQVLALTADCMKKLEALDAISVYSADQETKVRRKRLVDGFITICDQCTKLQNCITEKLGHVPFQSLM